MPIRQEPPTALAFRVFDARGGFRNSLRDAAGTNLVEAALITPLLLLLTFSIADFGSLFYVHLALENGISQATRYAITGNVMADPDNEGQFLSREQSIKAAMRQATPTLTLEDDAFSFHYLPDGEDTWLNGTGEPGDIVKARVDYTWDIITPLMRPFFPNGQVHVTVESAMKNEGRFE
jgi:hypothetical protein